VGKRNEEHQNIGRPTIKYDKKDIIAFAENHYSKNEDQEATWNGRQIRNAFQTAIAIAEYDIDKKIAESKMEPAQAAQKKKYQIATLKKSYFKKVSKATSEFDRYVRKVHSNQTDAKLAHENITRFDDGSPEEEYVSRQKPQRPMPSPVQSSRKSVTHIETPTRDGKKREPEPKSPLSNSESDVKESKEDDISSDDERMSRA